ncbi:MAG: ATP-binding cassette domain-containing protein [Chloroflexi bacterium]|nr:ATP-binding cassette domain-containing protein [Chloroflexota bacterium]
MASERTEDTTSWPGSTVVRLQGVSVRRGGRTILGPLSWQVRDGQRWVVLGANGSGKTTLLSVLSMSLWPTTGTVEILGERFGKVDARELRRRIGSAGSAIESAMRPDLTTRILIMTARHGAFEPWWHVYDDADRARAAELATQFGLKDQLDQSFESLSAGERRRTSIARALMPDPDLLLLDEPTASLDLAGRELLLRDLEILASEPRPRSIILVTHHLEEIPAGFDHGLVLGRERALAAGPIAEVLRDEVLSEAFGMSLTVDSRAGRWFARMGGAGRAPRGVLDSAP